MKQRDALGDGMVTISYHAWMAMKLLALLSCTLLTFLAYSSGSEVIAAQDQYGEPPLHQRPNILFIQTDDQSTDMLRYMPYLKSRLTDRGTKFENTIVTNPWCCPSRVSTLRGQYAHNHDIWHVNPPTGGNPKFEELGLDDSTVATWVQDAGYATGYVGRYLNAYHSLDIPPGYNEWYGRIRGAPNYAMNTNGKTLEYRIHENDMYSLKAQSFIERRSKLNRPFFLQIGTFSPHSPGFPAQRHEDEFRKIRIPRTPATNEADVSDKPAYVKERKQLTTERMVDIRLDYRERVRALQSADEMVRDVFTSLSAAGELNNTYVFFYSDNGYQHGEHRLTHKRLPYEESIRFPLLVFGPGVARGESDTALVGNHDLAPTFADIAGADTPDFVDGSSIAPLLRGETDWRDTVLSESKDVDADNLPGWRMVRTKGWKYTEYDTGEKELYDLTEDPYELQSLHGQRPDIQAGLSERLDALRDCSGDECRSAEGFTP